MKKIGPYKMPVLTRTEMRRRIIIAAVFTPILWFFFTLLFFGSQIPRMLNNPSEVNWALVFWMSVTSFVISAFCMAVMVLFTDAPKDESIPPEVPFTCLGLGIDETPGCFVCGGQHGEHNSISFFVMSRELGKLIVRLFGRGAVCVEFPWCGFVVKVGACIEHAKSDSGPGISSLIKLLQDRNYITREIVEQARSATA